MINKNDKENNPITEFPMSLEGGTELQPAQFTDVSILAEAPQHYINLDALEDYQAAPVKAESANVGDISAVVKDNNLWQQMDVSLSDMVNYVLDSSERPVIMITDDRIIYANPAALHLLDINSLKEASGNKFLRFVERGDRNLLAESIGEMLTSAKKLTIRLKSAGNRIHPVEFQAVYLPDSTHFSFILIGSHESKPVKPQQVFNNLYDELTGLPNFFLFEDRVQMAVNNENYKDVRLPKDLIAVAAVSIDNIDVFRRLKLENYAIKKLANTLVLSLKKNYTVGRGLRYPFWILMPDVVNAEALKIELEKLKAIFNDGVSDNFTTHEVVVSIGVSVFPNPARSAKKLVEQAIFALKKAQEQPGSRMERFEIK